MKPVNSLAMMLLGSVALSACSSVEKDPTHVPMSYLETSQLDRNPIGVKQSTEYLKVPINTTDSQLRINDKNAIKQFVAAYRDSGHGALIMSLPGNSANGQLAVEAVAEARAIAYESGVDFQEISGTTHDASREPQPALIMAYQSFQAVAPNCKSLAHYDLSDFSSNESLPTLGCSVRTNQAAMVADAADLLGQRELEPGDNVRRDIILAAFREGTTTGAQRSNDESGTVSEAVAE